MMTNLQPNSKTFSKHEWEVSMTLEIVVKYFKKESAFSISFSERFCQFEDNFPELPIYTSSSPPNSRTFAQVSMLGLPPNFNPFGHWITKNFGAILPSNLNPFGLRICSHFTNNLWRSSSPNYEIVLNFCHTWCQTNDNFGWKDVNWKMTTIFEQILVILATESRYTWHPNEGQFAYVT